MEIRPSRPSLDHSQTDVLAIAQDDTHVTPIDVAINRRHVDAPALDQAGEDDLRHTTKRLLGFGRINAKKTELNPSPVPSLYPDRIPVTDVGHSRPKPPRETVLPKEKQQQCNNRCRRSPKAFKGNGLKRFRHHSKKPFILLIRASNA